MNVFIEGNEPIKEIDPNDATVWEETKTYDKVIEFKDYSGEGEANQIDVEVIRKPVEVEFPLEDFTPGDAEIVADHE